MAGGRCLLVYQYAAFFSLQSNAVAGSSSASNSRSVYSRSTSGSDSRTISASSYSSAQSGSSYSSARSGSSYTTDSRPATAMLPAIAGARPQIQTVKQPMGKGVAVLPPQAAVQGGRRRPDTASSSGSESGSDSSYTSSSSGSSYSRYVHSWRLDTAHGIKKYSD